MRGRPIASAVNAIPMTISERRNFKKSYPRSNKQPLFRAAIAFGFILMSGCTSNPPRPDTILVNGKIITVDKAFSLAEAVAIRKGKLIGVGTNEEILKLRGDSTQTIDLKGHAVIPGLIEGHAHPIQ